MMKLNEKLLERLERSLTNITPGQTETIQIEQLRGVAKDLASHIAYIPEGREQSLAATLLEETVMWAVKGILLGE